MGGSGVGELRSVGMADEADARLSLDRMGGLTAAELCALVQAGVAGVDDARRELLRRSDPLEVIKDTANDGEPYLADVKYVVYAGDYFAPHGTIDGPLVNMVMGPPTSGLLISLQAWEHMKDVLDAAFDRAQTARSAAGRNEGGEIDT